MAESMQNDCNQRMPRTSLLNEMERRQYRSIFGPHTDSDVLAWMKEAALNPWYSQPKQKAVCKQILEVRKIMLLSNGVSPQRKRKLQKFIKDKAAALEKSDQNIISKLSRRPSYEEPSVSCLLNPEHSKGSLDQQVGTIPCAPGIFLISGDILSSKEAFTPCVLNALDMEVPEQPNPIVDTDESVNGSTPSTPGNCSPNYLPIIDFDDVDASYSLRIPISTQAYLKKPRRSPRLQNFIGDSLPGMAIPVGHRFQADIPAWSAFDTVTFPSDNSDSDALKWLGTKVWPIEGQNADAIVDNVGRGRPDTCSCSFLGAVECIRRHVLEKRHLLQADIGSAFFSWKFDEMGEDVSKHWTLKEQESFKKFLNTSLSNGKNFWKNALSFFPSKNRENIVSYYFNVFIPKQMGEEHTKKLTKCSDSETHGIQGAGKTQYMRQQLRSGKIA